MPVLLLLHFGCFSCFQEVHAHLLHVAEVAASAQAGSYTTTAQQIANCVFEPQTSYAYVGVPLKLNRNLALTGESLQEVHAHTAAAG
jgi:hypothetical protein